VCCMRWCYDLASIVDSCLDWWEGRVAIGEEGAESGALIVGRGMASMGKVEIRGSYLRIRWNRGELEIDSGISDIKDLH
jgi:hypothetical protein